MVHSSLTAASNHIVAVRFNAMGDVALTTGVLLDWHCKHGTSFTVITRKAFAPLFKNHPAVQNVLGLPEEDLHGPAQTETFRLIADKYKEFPLLDLHLSLRSAILARLWHNTVIPYKKMTLARRVFLWSKGRFCGEKLNSCNVPQRYAAGLYQKEPVPSAEELRPCIFLSEEERRWAAEQTASFRSKGPLVILHPFATHMAKTWCMEQWLVFADLLRTENIPYIWVGTQKELPESEIKNSFTGKTDLRQLCALLNQASVLVTGDSGPMHLAAGVNTPVLTLFGPTCREWGFFPCGPKDKVIQLNMSCRPCSLHGSGTCSRNNACIRNITAKQVLQELKAMLF